MATALGVASSILSLAELTCRSICYIRSVKNAPKEARDVARELQAMEVYLNDLVEILNSGGGNNVWTKSLCRLDTDGGSITRLIVLLTRLSHRLQQPKSKWLRLKKRAMWPLVGKEEVEELLHSIRRVITLLMAAVQLDGMKLDIAIKEDLEAVREDVKVVRDHTGESINWFNFRACANPMPENLGPASSCITSKADGNSPDHESLISRILPIYCADILLDEGISIPWKTLYEMATRSGTQPDILAILIADELVLRDANQGGFPSQIMRVSLLFGDGTCWAETEDSAGHILTSLVEIIETDGVDPAICAQFGLDLFGRAHNKPLGQSSTSTSEHQCPGNLVQLFLEETCGYWWGEHNGVWQWISLIDIRKTVSG
ncbi:hypothetical protein EV360DRAFT_75755 [Lentinula raphanica]|nr:hypothetical protein EV360DRAFT_75755 [Lentinula raphanica]